MRTLERPKGTERHADTTEKLEADAKESAKNATTFFAKINADWIFNLSAILAYNFLTSIFPLMLVILAIAGLIIGNLSPTTYNSMVNSIASALPSGIGHTIVTAATTSLKAHAGLILIIGVVTAIFGGSRLFVAIENVFAAVLRLHPRSFIRQNVVAIIMTIVFAIGGPLIFLAGIIPELVLKSLSSAAPGPLGSIVTEVIGIAIGFVVAAILFGVIYVVMPNQRVDWRDVWKGSLVAAALLVVYQILFPLYESFLLHPGNYGSLAGFAILLLVFLYYLSFILLLGLEINAWAQGQCSASSELVIFTQPEKATKAPTGGQRSQTEARQSSASRRPAAISRLEADGRSATAAITHHGSQSRDGQTTSRPNRSAKRSQRHRSGPPPVISRPPASADAAGALNLDEPPATRRFSLTTTLAAGLTALSVIAIQLARRPRRLRHA